jgi:hypothetical protein
MFKKHLHRQYMFNCLGWFFVQLFMSVCYNNILIVITDLMLVLDLKTFSSCAYWSCFLLQFILRFWIFAANVDV